jgi:phosphatidylserine/phosphatidylglycerophosphate/cardiolipin synthase-like enzyme
MKKRFKYFFPVICLSSFFPLASLATTPASLDQAFPSETSYSVCFTPQENCTAVLINQIKQAKNSIYIQSYSFTSYKIAKALADAYERGVEVNIILDSSNFDPKNFSQESYFQASGLSLWEDDQVRIAHNKIMIFDETTVETGSFNYTTSAQKYNAENMLIIKDKTLAETYLKNWNARKALSKKIN